MQRHQDSHIQLAALFRSFAHPTRIAIIEKLAQQGNCIEDEIIPVNEIAEPTVVEHLRSMKHEGLVKGKLNRSNMSYCINWEKIDECKLLFDQLYDQLNAHRQTTSCNHEKL